MQYREYPDNPHTYIVHRTTGTGEQGGEAITIHEEIFAADTWLEAVNWGQNHYPRRTGWEYDGFEININTLTDKGKEELKRFEAEFALRTQHIKDHPEQYSTYQMENGSTLTMQYNELLDGPRPKQL